LKRKKSNQCQFKIALNIFDAIDPRFFSLWKKIYNLTLFMAPVITSVFRHTFDDGQCGINWAFRKSVFFVNDLQKIGSNVLKMGSLWVL